MQPDNQEPTYSQDEDGSLQDYSYTEYATDSVEKDSRSVTQQDRSGDEELVRWQAAEYINRPKKGSWYIIFALVVIGLMVLAIFIIKEYSFAVLIPVMAASLILYIKRPAPVISYVLSRKGLHLNDKLYAFVEFREFNLVRVQSENMITLIPRKRFQLGVSFYFPEESGEAIIDILAARLPMKESKPDAIDRFIKFLGM